jgi:FkbM family methyltransferase
MIKNYETEIYERSGRPIDGLDGWMWIRGDGGPGTDGGAWYGPRINWTDDHQHKFFTHVKKFDTVIQAGGNLGLYPRLLANRFKFVYTFEPDPLNFHCLVNNCQVDNVVKINAALGEKNEFVQVLRNHRSNVGMHQVRVHAGGLIPVLSIDSFNFESCDMIILDTEGYDHNILKGAVNTIRKFKPVITAENNNGLNILDIIGEFGYRVLDQSAADTIFITDEG